MSAMESSSVVAFRAFVMIACLVLVPLAAVVGSAFPDLVKSVIVDRFVASTSKPASANTPAGASNVGPAPAYGQSPASAPFPQAELAVAADSTPAWSANSVAHPDNSNPKSSPRMPAENMAVPASFAAPEENSRAAWESRQLPGPAATAVAVRAQDNLGGESRVAPQYQPTVRSIPAQQAGADVTSASTSPERFTTLTRRLREYGATYYRLETWGKQDELFRFHCEIAAGNNPAGGRRFEAADSDPLLAITHVVEQVESWRAGR